MKNLNIFYSRLKPALFLVFLLIITLVSVKPALGACDCGGGGAFGATWTAPEACFSDSDCLVPCEEAFTGTTLPSDMTYVCATTAGGTPSTSTETDESATKTIDLQNPLGGTTSLPVLIGNIIKTILTIVGALALAMFIYGGFTWLVSGGSAEKIKKGKDILFWAVVGLVVIFASYSLVDFLLTAFGVAP